MLSLIAPGIVRRQKEQIAGPGRAIAQIADSNTRRLLGVENTKVVIQGVKSAITFYAMDVMGMYPAPLGKPWLRQNRVEWYWGQDLHYIPGAMGQLRRIIGDPIGPAAIVEHLEWLPDSGGEADSEDEERMEMADMSTSNLSTICCEPKRFMVLVTKENPEDAVDSSKAQEPEPIRSTQAKGIG